MAWRTAFFLNNKNSRNEAGQPHNGKAKKPGHPFSRRTFCQEVNSLARKKAVKKNVLGVYTAEAELKLEQAKESKKEKVVLGRFLDLGRFLFGQKFGKNYPSQK